MNNPFENDPLKDINSLADDLLKHQNADHQNDMSSLHEHHSAFGQHFEHHHHQPHTPNADYHSASDPFHTPPNTLDFLQPDNLPLPDFETPEHHQHNPYQAHEQMAGDLHGHFGNGQVHYHEHVACSSKNPEIYTTVSDDGDIYKHTPDIPNGTRFGFVDNLNVYSGYRTPSKIYLGHGNNDGKIYDSHDKCVGWVNPDGHVYNTSGVEVYQTTRGVAGAAAYLLCAYQGGVA